MRKIYTASICKLLFIVALFLQSKINAQTTVATPYTGSFTSFAAPANIAFVAQNTNAGDIILTGLSQYCQTTENNSVWELYYSSTSLSGVGTPVPGSEWTLIATSLPVPVAADGVVPVFANLNFTIPAGAQYRFAMKNTGPGSTRYVLTPSPNVNTVAGGGVNLFLGNYQIAGENVGYSGQNTALGTTPRYWHGSITFIPATPCTSPPNPGTATASPTPICTGAAVQLNLTGNTFGTGQTYVWQSSSTSGGTYTDISTSSGSSALTINPTTTTWYRAAVTCGGNTQYSVPVEVVVSPAFPGGTYTINSALPTGGGNYQTFAAAVNALSCGIAGPVIFNVAAGSGPYTEQVTIPFIGGSSAINTVTFNCNGTILQATPVTADRHILKLDDADYITFYDLNIVAQPGSTYGWGVHLTNGADYNTINNCVIDISAVTSTTQSNSGGIVGTNSTTSVTAAGNANNNTISNNTIIGAYQGIIMNGTATGTLAVNNTITNNIIRDFYANGIELTHHDGATVSFNDIHRANRAAVTTFAGIELGAGNRNVTVNANRIHDTHTSASTQTGTAYGIYANACDAPSGAENKIINNLINRFNSGSGLIYGLYNSGSDGFYYYHNTVVLDNAASTGGTTRGFYQTTLAANIEVKNNIIHIARGGTGSKHCLYFGTTTSTIVSNKNVLYQNSPAGTNGIGSFGTTNYATLANWQTANGGIYDQQSVSTDPLYVNAPGGDYTPTAISINNIGDVVGVATDILNAPRTIATPDPGAYEFGVVLPCTDPPTAGTLSATPNPVCIGSDFTIVIIGGTTGTGQTYQWQSSPDNSVWTDIPGATQAFLTTNQSVNTYYRVNITCGTGTATSASLLVESQLCYCTSIPTSTIDTEIWEVSLNGSPNTSDCVTPAPGPGSILNRYSNFYPNGPLTAVLPGTMVPFSVVIDDCTPSTYYSSGCAIWIDFNKDGDFEDAGEQVYLDNATSAAPRTITGNITIPAGATTGITGMRVVVAETFSGSGLQPCMTYTYGETEDYLINIISPVPCAGSPTAGSATTTKAVACTGESFTLSATGVTLAVGITYQWQSSPDNINWTDITGATSISLTTSQTASTYYRLVVTCTNSSISVNSTSVQVLTPVLVSGAYTINNALPTGGTNFNSFNDAYDYIKCGINGPVIFNVDPASGPYTEQLIITQVPGASATNTVTFNGNGRIIQFTSNNSAERAVIKLNGADHFIFDSLTINATATTTTEYGFGIQLLNDADSNIVRSCTINITKDQTSTNHVGISISASATSATTTGNTMCDNNLFEDNVITGGYYGITNYGSSTVANQRNKFLRNTIKDFYLYGLANNGTFQTTIDGNDISRPTRTVLSTGTAAGVYFTGLSTSANVNGNYIHDMLGGNTTLANDVYGIYFTGVDALSGLDNVVSNNVIYNINSNGIIYGLYNAGSDNVLYYHNTIAIDDPASTTTDVTRGFYQTTSAAGIVLFNNIFTLRRGGTGNIHGLYFNTPASSILSNYNDVFFTPGANIFYGYNGSDQAILADWQAATGQDANSFFNDPFYENPAAGNFKPTSAVIDDLGSPVGITNDVLGMPRSATTPDIGAYEYASPPCTTPPTPGTATVSATPVCENSLVGLGATGFSIGSGQTYQWQSSVDIGGPYTNISAATNTPSFNVIATETLYYRLAITCGGSTEYSVPVLLTVSPGLPGGTYTIDPSQPASATNFISFNAAKDAMACGITGPVVFEVEPGSPVFNEQLLLDSIPGTSNINTITFNGAGNTIRFSSSATGERAVIRLSGTDHTTFNNLTIDAVGAGTYGWGVWLLNGADSNAFNNCNILSSTTSTSSTNFAGVVITGSTTTPNSATASNCDGNVFDGNTISGGYYGMTMMSSSAAPIRNNKFINNQVRDFYSYGIYVGNTIDGLVEKNVISRPTRSSITTHYGIYGGGTTNLNLRVSKNRITNPTGGASGNTSALYGIYFAADGGAGQEVKITNNILDNFDGGGSIYALYNSSANNVHYYHNTVSLDNTANTSTNLSRGFYQTGTAAGIIFKNNIISITRGGTGAKHAIYFGTTGSTITSNRNDLYVDPSVSTSYVGYFSGNQATLANWQSASSQDANSQSIDPLFVNAATGDVTPQQALIDDKGEPVGITTDFLNAPRSLTTPDIGAIEFAIVPCTEPPVAGTSTADPSSGICLGTWITLDLTGNSTGGFQQYIWQFGPSAAGPWLDISDTLYSPQFLYELSSYSNNWFRAIVKCGTSTDFSVPVQVIINPALLAGDYTIDPSQPASASNYQSFSTAIAALQCGIAGSVRFHVVPGTYTEQNIIKKVPGASATSTVTFMSQNGDPASVILRYNSLNAALNYVMKLDSASFITFKNMSINALNASNGRAIEFAGTASADSILNCVIDVPSSSSTANVIAGIFGTALTGTDIVIKGNTITDGSSNIYLSGTAGSAKRFVIDSNSLNGAYYYGIYAGGINSVNIRKNNATRSGILNTTSYGIYLTNCDSVYRVDDNIVTIQNAGTTNYGIYLTGCAAHPLMPGSVSRNKITAVNNITSATLYGLYQTGSVSNYTVNNIIDVNSTGATVRGLYSSTGGGIRYYNNTVRNSSPSTATTNVAAYFSQTSGTSGVTNIRNNVFYHAGNGVAMYQGNVANIYCDYNMYSTNGATLILQGSITYPTLQAWRNAENWDYNSIVYTPALVAGSSLQPDINDANSWAMHGRGVQITDNTSDINGDPRPTTLTTGVPDLGAYEFLPAVMPPVLPGTPAAPAPNTTQYFMFGTDTVQKISWGVTVPTNVEVRRYSGIIPPNLAVGQQSMYFYTDVDITGSTPSAYTMRQYYIDPWMRNIPAEPTVKMGRTDAANNWIVSSNSAVDIFNNVITESGLTFMDKYTGMTDGQAPAPPIGPGFTTDTSNRGRRFWVGYGHHYGFSTNGQTMVLYLSAEQAANVTVKVNGTGWVRNYAIPANTVTVSDPLPESGLIDSRILDEGLSNNGISIESDVPIVAYAHIYQGSNSGASMLLPVGTYGYEYRSLNASQYYPTGGAGSHSWFFVIADRDSTLVEITPSVATKGGRPAGVPFQVYLMRGQIYNVMGTQPTAAGTDISGSTIKSIPNASGKCYPIAVFSGSSRTALCNTTNGDNMIQQMFPNSAWGTKYLTFATANSASTSLYYSNKWRVMVKDPATVVMHNGVQLNPATLVVPGNYYEIGITGGSGSSTASYFEADQPIMVAQYMISSDGTGCAGLAAPGGDGDPEMIYISPIEQGIKRAVFYTTDESAINSNYINVIIPTAGLASLTIDGSSTFTDVFAHPHLAGYTCIRQNLGGTAGQHIIQSDSAFTAITYGLGSVESYGYNAGTLVKNLSATPFFNNVFSSATTSSYTCKGTPFNLKIQISVKPTQLIWNLSQVPNISPNADVVQNNPVPADSVTLNGKKFYIYTLAQNYTFSAVGNYLIPITVFHPSIEGCGGSIEITLPVSVIAAPVSDFTVSAPNCVNEQVQFNATTTTSNGTPVNQWTWDFGDNSTGNGQNPVHTYTTAGTFNVALRGIADDGCVGDTTKALVINAKPTPVIVEDTVYVCNNASATFNVQNPVAGAVYNWYSAETGGTLLGTGNSVTINNVTGFVNVYLEAIVGGCASVTRDRATAAILPTLATPVVVVDTVGVNMIRFRWSAVPNAIGYEVSTNNGATWTVPSSGSTGLTHTVSGLTLGASVTIQVRALGGCLPSVSAPVQGQTRTDQVYIPNSFTPNGDGRNDVLRVYSNVIRSMKMVIFNQWGEKVYESTDQNLAWDGTYKGKPQPSGVYIYVAEIIINTGEKISRKGSINLVR